MCLLVTPSSSAITDALLPFCRCHIAYPIDFSVSLFFTLRDGCSLKYSLTVRLSLGGPNFRTIEVCLERFWYFLNEHGCEGSVIYERFHLRQRKTVCRAIQKLQSMQNHNTFPDLGSIKHTIRNGDPIQEKVLQSLISLHMCRT